jgi:riboflavin synthase alpha subunit
MTTATLFTKQMLQGNSITWTKKAEITINGTCVTINQYKDEPADVWVSTPTTYNRVAKNMELNQAIDFANNLLKSFN